MKMCYVIYSYQVERQSRVRIYAVILKKLHRNHRWLDKRKKSFISVIGQFLLPHSVFRHCATLQRSWKSSSTCDEVNELPRVFVKVRWNCFEWRVPTIRSRKRQASYEFVFGVQKGANSCALRHSLTLRSGAIRWPIGTLRGIESPPTGKRVTAENPSSFSILLQSSLWELRDMKLFAKNSYFCLLHSFQYLCFTLVFVTFVLVWLILIVKSSRCFFI